MELQHPEYHHQSSIKSDGSRPKIRIADVHGKFTQLKKGVFPFLLAIFLIMPWLRFGGERLILLWVERREFTLFGFPFNAQDIYLIFFLLTGFAFSLFFVTALVGRIWCGWTCPQTVFLEGVFRKIERWIEGSRSEQLKLEKGPLNGSRIGKFFAKHFLFITISLMMSLTLTLYFIPGSYYAEMWNDNAFSHPVVLFWIFFLAALFYFDFGWFREQVCLILCPYGRFQSALTDDDSLVIGYDKHRGEPRGKNNDQGAGDCIDCGRCIAVCPTGIDIRAGLQLECVGCANCIDACDEIMTKMNRPLGLIRYDSLNGLEGKPRKILRPRIYLYIFLMIVGATVAFFNVRERKTFEANVIRLAGPPFIMDATSIRNQFEIHLVNKENHPHHFAIKVIPTTGLEVILPVPQVELQPRQDKHIPWMAVFPANSFKQSFEIKMLIQDINNGEELERKVLFLGPK